MVVKRRLFSKKGQAENAASLVLIIGVFIIAYLVLMPVEDKREMMGESPLPSQTNLPPLGQGYGSSLKVGNLLSENPGLMDPILETITQTNLASVDLFSVESQSFENIATNIHLENSLVSEDEAEFTFVLDDLNNLEDVRLLFFVLDYNGELEVKLNGVKVLSGEITSDVLPITLPRSLLGRVNRLSFEVEGPNVFQFMTVNYYELKDVMLVKNYLVENNVEFRQFVLTEDELKNMNHASLVYRLNCMSLKYQGRIMVKLNGRVVQNSLAVCDAGFTEIDFSLVELVEGRNILEFGVDQGHYVMENLAVESDYSSQEYPRYYFSVQVETMEDIFDGDDITLQSNFENDGKRKSGTFYVNGYPIYFDTYTSEFTADLNGLIYEGQNVISIIPETKFEMLNLNVFME